MSEKNIAVTNRTHRMIGGIKLNKTGLKGIEVTYETVEILNGVSYISEDIKKSKRPVHRELKTLVKSLTPYMIELLGFPEKGINDLDFEVSGIKAGKDRFVVTGSHRCWGDKTIGVATPQIKEVDDYDSYDAVMEIVDKIYKETDLYLSGVRSVRGEDVVVDYMKGIKKSSEFEFADFENMSKEDQDALLAEIQKDMEICVHEENGQLVIGSKEDSSVEEEAEEEPAVVEEVAAKEEPKKDKKVQVKKLTQEKPKEVVVEEEPEESIVMDAGDDDDFVLPGRK